MFPIVKDWPMFQTGSLASLANLSEVAHDGRGMLPQVLGPLVFLLGKASGADSKNLELFLKKIKDEAALPPGVMKAANEKTGEEEKAFANEANIAMRHALDSTKGSEKTLEQIGKEAVGLALKNEVWKDNKTAKKIQNKLAKEAKVKFAERIAKTVKIAERIAETLNERDVEDKINEKANVWQSQVLGDMGWEFPEGEGENYGKDWFRTKDENGVVLKKPIDTKKRGRTKETKWN